jgi:hypothetical protein
LAHRRALDDYVDWLRGDPVGRLSLATDRSMSLLARFQDFFTHLDPEIVGAYLAVGASPMDALSVDDCASLLNLDQIEAERLLERLVDAGMVEVDAAGDYYVYPLLRTMAQSVTERIAASSGVR